MSPQAKFISGDGVEHEVAVDSPAFELMSKQGSFTRVDVDAADEVAEEAPVDLSKMNRTRLIEEAALHGITIDAADKSQTKAVITAAIEAAAAETETDEGKAAE